MPDTSVPDVPHESLLDVFGPMPTRVKRGDPVPVGAKKTQYRQVSRDYAPVKPLELSDYEVDVFTKHGLPDVVKFSAAGEGFEGSYYWCPREPGYTIYNVNNALGLHNIVVNMQSHMIGAWGVFFLRDQVYPHPSLLSLWDETFAAE